MNISVATRLGQWRTRLADRILAFRPSIDTLSIGGHHIRFLFATPQAVDWYVPLGPHLQAEFEWVARRLSGRTERVVDAGAFHGLYSLVFAKSAGAGSRVIAVDPVPSNCAVIEANVALNGVSVEIVQAAVAESDGTVSFTGDSCGRIDPAGAVTCQGRRLPSIMPDATVIKLDIEGAELRVLRGQLDELPSVHTWMVEIHPDFGVPADEVVALFTERCFDLYRLDRASARVVRHPAGAAWSERTSLIAARTS